MKKLLTVGCALVAGLALAGACPCRDFGKLSDGRETKVWRIRGAGGMILDVTDYGGRIVRCLVPDKYGNLADVTLGWNTAAEYERNGCSMGALMGRFVGRIRDGRFTLDGQAYQLPVCEDFGARHSNLHGGPMGWDTKIWQVKSMTQGQIRGLELSCVSEDGDMGFPGKVACTATYLVLPTNTWSIDYEATTDKPTVLNLTNHAYWNMAGEASGGVLDQELQVFADKWTKTDDALLPVSDEPVAGTGFDFTTLRRIGAKADWMAAQAWLECTGNWYDHNFVLRGKIGELHPAATLRDPVSGRRLEIWTTEPCVQVYGPQDIFYDGSNVCAKTAGRLYGRFPGIALETQHYPDSPNHPEFPSTVLRPGETFKSRTEYRFSAE